MQLCLDILIRRMYDRAFEPQENEIILFGFLVHVVTFP